MRIRSVGADALLLEVDEPAAWFTELWRLRDAGELAAVEIVPGAGTVLIDGVTDPVKTTELVRALQPPAVGDAPTGGVVEVAVTFDGQDLGDVAQLWGTDERGVIDRLAGTEFRVAFCGFTPGWAYLRGLPADLAVPRRQTPRPRVPAGSVGLADTYAGIYPTASPGGWQLVGRSDAVLFDPDREPPALLTPGTRVRIVESTTDPQP
jgi:KipI family sensor histidine kinase inhibitor